MTPEMMVTMALKLTDAVLMVAEMRAEDRAEIEGQVASLRATIGTGPSDETMAALEADGDAIIERLKTRAG